VKLYFAGLIVGEGAESLVYSWRAHNRLLSFADKDNWAKDSFNLLVHNEPPPGVSLFLDSGAFSAWSRGAVLNMGDYCRYIHQYEPRFATYCNLDVIGDWRGSARNLDKMLADGLKPMAVFHKGSPWDELHRLASLGLPLALGGLVGKGKSVTAGNIQIYLDACWARLKDHWPIRVHVFGVVAQWVLERYPWFSADSSTALVSAGMGRVQQWVNGHVQTDNWILYAQRTLNGGLVDGVALNKAKNGSAHLGRREHNVQCQLALERHVTDLWTSRGVTWDGDNYTGSLS
jgi:hypothetical protein